MAFIPVENGVRVAIQGTMTGQTWVNTLGVLCPVQPSVADLTSIATQVKAWWVAQMKPLVTSTVFLTAVTATDLDSASAPTVTIAASDSGTATGSAVANNTALVTSFRTAGRGRSSRGRNYVPGLSTTGASGTSASSTAAGLQAAAYALLNQYLQLGIQEFIHVVISYILNGSPRTSGLVQPVSSYITNVDFDSQRRRLAGRGV